MITFDPEKCIRCGKCVADCVVSILKSRPDGIPMMSPEDEQVCVHCQHCLAICPTGAVNCFGKNAADCPPNGELPSESDMLNLLRQRRTIRHYKDENLDAETMAKLKNSLHWTATGCNDHSLFFAVVEDKKEMDFFRSHTANLLKLLFKFRLPDIVMPSAKRYLDRVMKGEDMVFRGAPHMIVVAVSKRAPCAKIDPMIALSNFDLYAQTLGVGTCWCGFADLIFRLSKKQRSRLNIPRGYKIGYVMLFGKPAVSYPRATTPEPFQVHTVKAD